MAKEKMEKTSGITIDRVMAEKGEDMVYVVVETPLEGDAKRHGEYKTLEEAEDALASMKGTKIER